MVGLKWTVDPCLRFPSFGNDTQVNNDTCPLEFDNITQSMSCPDGWVYDKSSMEATLATEYDIVCEDGYKIRLLGSVLLGGLTIG